MHKILLAMLLFLPLTISLVSIGGGGFVPAPDYPVRFDSGRVSNQTVLGGTSMSLKITPAKGDYLVIDSVSCGQTASIVNSNVRIGTVTDNQSTIFSYKINSVFVTGSTTRMSEEIWAGRFTGSRTDNVTVTWRGFGIGTPGLNFTIKQFAILSYMNVNASAVGNRLNKTQAPSTGITASFPASANGAWIYQGLEMDGTVPIAAQTGRFQRNTMSISGTGQSANFNCQADAEDRDDFSTGFHSTTTSYTGGKIALMTFELIPNIGIPQAGNSGPCTYYIQKTAANYVITAKVDIAGLKVGMNVSTPNTNDFRAFFQPFVNNEAVKGGGWNCFDNGEYDINTNSTCNMTAAGQGCGLLMRGHGIFFSCAGYDRPSFGTSFAAPNLTPCYLKYTGISQINCLLCWGQFNASREYYGGGITGVTVDGNGVAMDCVETGDVQDFTMHRAAAVNCLSNDLHMMAAEPGGTSNDFVDANLFGATISMSTGVGVFMDAGIAQTWMINNFFVITYGYAIIANGGPGGNTNLIQSNHIENCKTGTGGQYKAGTCIFDTDNFDIIAFNQLTIQADYNCIYSTGTSTTIISNTCLQANTLNFSDGSCIFIETSPNSMIITNNLCNNTGGGGSGNMKYGVDCFACGTSITITTNLIIGASVSAVNFFNGASEGITSVFARENSGYNPVNKITNFVCTTCATTAWAPVGTSSTIVASTTYTIAFIDQYWTCALNGAVGVSITIKDNNGNIVESGLTCTGGVVPGAMTPIFTPVGYSVNFGAFVGGPPLVFDFGN